MLSKILLKKSVIGSFAVYSRNGNLFRRISNASVHFRPKNVAVVSKVTRYEYEKRTSNASSEAELKHYLESKHSDYNLLLELHNHHNSCLEKIKKCLTSKGINARVVQRFHYDNTIIDWADVIFTAGGDGTFLLGASKIRDRSKPLIGVCTDPKRSEGYLCLPKKEYSADNFESALKRLHDGNFAWKYCQRVRVTMSGRHENDDSVLLLDQQLQFPEHRFHEHVREHETTHRTASIKGQNPPERILPVLALNEVFLGESLSSRVSYYELTVDNQPGIKQKSSGLTVCTGTGSSSWYFHINQIPIESVKEVLSIAKDLTGSSLPLEDASMLKEVAAQFNSSLRFDPSLPKLAYTVRDPINNSVFQVAQARGFAKRIQVFSRMWDACVVIDGGSSFKFNDGAIATLEMYDEDALRTVTFD